MITKNAFFKEIILLFLILIVIHISIKSIYKKQNNLLIEAFNIIKLKDIEKPNMSILRIKGYDENKIYEFRNFLKKSECKDIIKFSKSKVEDSMVVCKDGKDCLDDYRTSKSTFIKDNDLYVADLISKKLEKLLCINKNNFEELQVVYYKPGKQYKEHWDACISEDVTDCDNLVKKAGQRYATFLIYLNDVSEGGETCFPKLDKDDNIINESDKQLCTNPHTKKIKPEQGKGILFFNLEKNGIDHKDIAMHAGLPPIKGEKWLCNKWIRTRSVI